MATRQRNFRMERLEERQMMAGDVTASFTMLPSGLGGTLRIEEAAGQTGGHNSVFIKQMTDNTVRVIGTVNSDGQLSLVNGKQYVDFTIPPHTFYEAGIYLHPPRGVTLDIDLNAGNDKVSVADFRRPDSTFYLNDLLIDVQDTSGSADQDAVYISNVSVRKANNDEEHGRIKIFTGAGDDFVSINQASAHNTQYFENALGIGMSGGSDRVEIWNSRFYGNVFVGVGTATQNDVDDVKMVNVTVIDNSKLDVTLGGGDDTFSFDRITMDNESWYGKFSLDAGAGNDTGSIKNTKANSVKAMLGDGADTLVLDYIYATEMDVQGQGGFGDKLSQYHLSVDRVFESGWETINGLPVWNYNLTPATITTTPTRRTTTTTFR